MGELVTVAAVSGAADSANVAEAECVAAASFGGGGLDQRAPRPPGRCHAVHCGGIGRRENCVALKRWCAQQPRTRGANRAACVAASPRRARCGPACRGCACTRSGTSPLPRAAVARSPPHPPLPSPPPPSIPRMEPAAESCRASAPPLSLRRAGWLLQVHPTCSPPPPLLLGSLAPQGAPAPSQLLGWGPSPPPLYEVAGRVAARRLLNSVTATASCAACRQAHHPWSQPRGSASPPPTEVSLGRLSQPHAFTSCLLVPANDGIWLAGEWCSPGSRARTPCCPG